MIDSRLSDHLIETACAAVSLTRLLSLPGSGQFSLPHKNPPTASGVASMLRWVPSLFALPAEVVDDILSRLEPADLASASRTCRLLHDHVDKDCIWQPLVQRSLPVHINTTGPFDSWRDLYRAHHPHWFLPERKIWFADSNPYGKLIVSRYDQRRGCIEAYALVAERSGQEFNMLNWSSGPSLQYHPFQPKVQLDLNQPILCLSKDDSQAAAKHGCNVQSEIMMHMNTCTSDRLTSTFMFTRSLPDHLVGSNTSIWPPLPLPSPQGQRTRNASESGYRSTGHRPSRPSEASDAAFRIRTWVEFSHFFPAALTFATGSAGRAAEKVTTYATLPESSYTPTREKPWQGIWCGDYSAHGCEFLLVTQPDNPKPLPDKARRAFSRWPRSNVGYWGAQGTVDIPDLGSDSDGDDAPDLGQEVRPTSLAAARSFLEGSARRRSSLRRESAPPDPDPQPAQDEAPFKGRLEAVKLTGDPNVPRGEISFVAEDLGARGLVGHARDALFAPDAQQHGNQASDVPGGVDGANTAMADPNWKGARMVKSCGHIAGTGFAGDDYIPSQLVMISEDRLGMWWLRKFPFLFLFFSFAGTFGTTPRHAMACRS